MKRSRPVRDAEVERWAREALELQAASPGPLTDSQVNSALAAYKRCFGFGATIAFAFRVRKEISEKAWNATN